VDSASHILRSRGLRPKASWGQNFLDDEAALRRIADAAELRPGEPVVELGAGLGHLTGFLIATGAQVTAVERDRDLLQALAELRADNLRVVGANAANLSFGDVARKRPVVVVGNIPYHLTSSILFELLDQHSDVSRAVLTLQKEVADRLTAGPGGRDYGILSVLLGLYFDVQALFTLSPQLFHPPPKVSSTVVRLDALGRPRAAVLDEARFRRLVKAAFARRRKQISNSLKSDPTLGAPAEMAEALQRAHIEHSRRAETLSIEEFAALERALDKAR
jgi:16S rRNA (adenine1518-N6/adenine1519-N6)-dimethyltransferase